MRAAADLNQRIVITAGNPQKFQLLSGELRIPNQFLRLFGIGGRRKSTHPCKLIQIGQSKIQGLSATHGKSRNRPVFAVCQSGIFFFDEWNQIMQ